MFIHYLSHYQRLTENGTDEPKWQGRNKDADVENGLEDTVGEGEAGTK